MLNAKQQQYRTDTLTRKGHGRMADFLEEGRKSLMQQHVVRIREEHPDLPDDNQYDLYGVLERGEWREPQEAKEGEEEAFMFLPESGYKYDPIGMKYDVNSKTYQYDHAGIRAVRGGIAQGYSHLLRWSTDHLADWMSGMYEGGKEEAQSDIEKQWTPDYLLQARLNPEQTFKAYGEQMGAALIAFGVDWAAGKTMMKDSRVAKNSIDPARWKNMINNFARRLEQEVQPSLIMAEVLNSKDPLNDINAGPALAGYLEENGMQSDLVELLKDPDNPMTKAMTNIALGTIMMETLRGGGVAGLNISRGIYKQGAKFVKQAYKNVVDELNAIRQAAPTAMNVTPTTWDVMPRVGTNKQELSLEFGNRDDDFWGIEIDEATGTSSFKGSEYSGTQCTGYACAIKQKLGDDRVEVYGYGKDDNPTAGSNVLADGHDFAIVDNKYIVDPWLSEVESGRITTPTGETMDVGNQIVFDLEQDADLVKQIYGDRAKWETVDVDRYMTPESGNNQFQTPENFNKYYTPANVDRPGSLVPEHEAMETEFTNWVLEDVPRAIREYKKLPKTKGGVIIAVDEFRELYPPYGSDRSLSQAVHETSSAGSKILWDEAMATPGDKPIMLLSGGTGAGKSTVLMDPKIDGKHHAIFDSNLAHFGKATKKIDEALNNGFPVEVTHVWTDPMEAFQRAVNRAMRNPKTGKMDGNGRTVPISAHVNTHVESNKVIKQLEEHYADNPNFRVLVVNNNLGRGNARYEDTSVVDDNIDPDWLAKEAREYLDVQYEAGKINEKVYKGFIGTGKER